MKVTLKLVLDVERTDGKAIRSIKQAISEEIFEVLDARCKDETFLLGNVDHAVSVDELALTAETDNLNPLLAAAASLCSLVEGMREDMLARAKELDGENRKACDLLRYYAPSQGRTTKLRKLMARAERAGGAQ